MPAVRINRTAHRSVVRFHRCREYSNFINYQNSWKRNRINTRSYIKQCTVPSQNAKTIGSCFQARIDNCWCTISLGYLTNGAIFLCALNSIQTLKIACKKLGWLSGHQTLWTDLKTSSWSSEAKIERMIRTVCGIWQLRTEIRLQLDKHEL
jgi:hypothetical protein